MNKIVNKTLTLSNGTNMPTIGLGVWEMGKGEMTEQAVLWAIDAGYRHIDTASIYGNEREVGAAIRTSNISRDDLFITTKVWNDAQGYQSALKAFDVSLQLLNMDYVDLYLIHWPFNGWGANKVYDINLRKETWKALETIYASGRAKAIGVCNYTREHLEEMKEYANMQPMVNQIEFHPFWYRKELMEYCHANNIAVTDYCPLVRGRKLNDERITNIAGKYGKSNAQILIRWGLQHGNIVIPKSARLERIKENIDVYDFEISQEDMNLLDGLNEDFIVVKI